MKYKPTMVNVLFHVFIENPRPRLESEQHKTNKKGTIRPTTLQPHKVMLVKNPETMSTEYTSYVLEKRFRSVYMPKSFIDSYPKVVMQVYQAKKPLYVRNSIVGKKDIDIFIEELRKIQASAEAFCAGIERI